MQAQTTSGLAGVLDDAKDKVAEFRLYGPRIEAGLRRAEYLAQEMTARGTQVQSNAAQIALRTLLEVKDDFARTWQEVEQFVLALERTDISAASLGLLVDAGRLVTNMLTIQTKTKGAELVLSDIERQTGVRAPVGSLSPVATGAAAVIGFIIVLGLAQAARRTPRRQRAR